MHDLRKQVLLESGKTVSRKARSKQATPTLSRNASATTSPHISRVPSANASDDEDAYSDDTAWSTVSNEEPAAHDPDLTDVAKDAWAAELGDRINQICDRKRSSTQGREESLAAFSTALTRIFTPDVVQTKLDDLLSMLLKSIRAGASEKETVLALKALALVLITLPSDSLYDKVTDSLRTAIVDSEDVGVKIAAVHTMGVATFYSGASLDETQNIMEFFLDIAMSDGASAGAEDNAEVVTAVLEEWAFLATQLDDLEDITEEAMDTFVEQLDSTDVKLQIATGECIALLYEMSYTEAESDDERDESVEEVDPGGHRMVKRYTVYRQQHQLIQKVEQLAKASSKRMSKKDKKALHVAFTDVLHTIEKPTRGPRYSVALDEEGREFGSRMKISISGGGKMTIDTWSKLHRLNALKRLLQGGFLVHYEHNQVVFDTLPVILEHD